MQADVQIGCGARTLDQRDGAALAIFAFESNAIQQMARDHALPYLQHQRDQPGQRGHRQTQLAVPIQAQILDLLGELQARLGMAILLITHGMGVVAESTQRVLVTYAGRVVEEAPGRELFATPRHPYIQGLIRSLLCIDLAATHRVRLEATGGTVPQLINPAPGCRFARRYHHAQAACLGERPQLHEVAPGHKVVCTSRPARPWAWWVNQAAASPPPGAASCA